MSTSCTTESLWKLSRTISPYWLDVFRISSKEDEITDFLRGRADAELERERQGQVELALQGDS